MRIVSIPGIPQYGNVICVGDEERIKITGTCVSVRKIEVEGDDRYEVIFKPLTYIEGDVVESGLPITLLSKTVLVLGESFAAWISANPSYVTQIVSEITTRQANL